MMYVARPRCTAERLGSLQIQKPYIKMWDFSPAALTKAQMHMSECSTTHLSAVGLYILYMYRTTAAAVCFLLHHCEQIDQKT